MTNSVTLSWVTPALNTQRLLLVVYVERSLRRRIISSRPATRTERKLYEQF
ncbi:BrnT family toxin [Microcoleus sp. D3_18a_C4]|uniref:BrnT family toxin n=1 Tax=Microcoleus sp. D3_18a_C4 TaxID=3055332 RepID=UPI002FCF1F87